jgi:hypothetical protein
MANYKLMIYYINSVDKDITKLGEMSHTKPIIKKLISLQEYTRAAWAKVHSLVKTMTPEDPEGNFKRTQQIINMCLDMNLEINTYYNTITTLAVKIKTKKNNPDVLNYILEEMFYNYSIYLDALHFMGIYYIPAETFPFVLTDVFTQRKYETFAKLDGMEDIEEP